jgi:hypothetical protein
MEFLSYYRKYSLSEETTIPTLRLNLSYIGPNHIEDHASDHAALMQFL